MATLEEGMFAQFFESTQNPAFITDFDAFLQNLNAALEKILRLSAREVKGSHFSELVHPDDRSRFQVEWEQVRAGISPPPFEIRLRRTDGTFKLLALNLTPLSDDQLVFGIAQNLVQSRRTEEDQRQREGCFAHIIERHRDGIAIVDAEDVIQFANRSAEKFFGHLGTSLVGQRLDLLRLSGDINEITVSVDGVKRILEVSRQETEWLGANMCLISARDLTARKTLEERLQLSERLDAIGRLAGGIAHDFNNHLAVILMSCDLLLQELADDTAACRDIGEIRQAAQLATDLTRQLLAFSRKQVIQPRIIDLNDVVATMQRMIQRLIGEDIELIVKLDPSLPTVKADPGHMEQVIMNLAANARHAMPSGGKLIIETHTAELDTEYARQYGYVISGSYVMLAVTDTGTGMDSETRARIFEPFFTTKKKQMGTGLGLATVYGIIKQNAGYVWVYSEPGQGTSMKIYLPVVKDHVNAETRSQPTPIPRNASETILVVEDETSVRNLMRRVLEGVGYQVLETGNPEDAIALAKNDPRDISLVIADMVLPKMFGPDVVARIRPIRPGIKVLFLSGHSDHAVVQLGMLGSGEPFLQKPFTRDTLLQKVQETLSMPLSPL